MKYSRSFQLILVVATINLCVSTARAQASADSDSRAFLEKARASMVVITVENESGQTVATGAGFFIGRNLIATDLSVVISARRIRVQPAGQEQKVDASTYNNNRLVTILTVPGTDGPPLTLGNSDKVSVNDRVFLLGYANHESVVSEGMVTKIGTPGDARNFQISSPITSGSRGGPVFNSKGEVIGIAAESLAEPSPGVVMPVSYLTTLLAYVTGPGVGTGIGVGRGGGMGPGSPSLGPGFSKPEDQDHAATSTSVDTKPVLVKKVVPRYTEVARRNQVQGVVIVRVLVGADGLVKRATIVRGLPDGLNETAIAAAYQALFKPAMKDGQPVSYSVALNMEFNLR